MAEDKINHPSHYERSRFTCEPADLTSMLPHPIASAVEYIIRAPYKGTYREDMAKAVWWLKRSLEGNCNQLWDEQCILYVPKYDDYQGPDPRIRARVRILALCETARGENGYANNRYLLTLFGLRDGMGANPFFLPTWDTVRETAELIVNSLGLDKPEPKEETE